MLVSHKYKFIFIRTGKTASSSTELELSRIMGDDDIFIPKHLKHSRHLRHPESMGPLNTFRFRMFKVERWLLPADRWQPHMAARHVKKHIGAEIFDSYFKFCVEREPVDKCISNYWWLKRNPNYIERLLRGNMSWEQFLDNKKRWPIATHLWTDEAGYPMVDRILRYENLNEEIRQVGRELGFHIEGIKSNLKADKRRPGIKVTEEQREKIYQAFAESNRHTGYRL